jgi:hypothetical protein
MAEEVILSVKYFVSVDETAYANRTLIQYFDPDKCARGELKTVSGETVNVYEIERGLIKSIKRNSDLFGHVKFFTQSKDEPLKPLLILKAKKLMAKIKKGRR